MSYSLLTASMKVTIYTDCLKESIRSGSPQISIHVEKGKEIIHHVPNLFLNFSILKNNLYLWVFY